MSKLVRLSIAFKKRPLTQAFIDGRIKIPGVELEVHWEMSSTKRHGAVLRGDLDVGEMSTSRFVIARSENLPILGIPVFIKRGFIHQNLICRADSPLKSLSALRGKRIGIPSYNSSINVWARGLLKHEYGVSAEEVEWLKIKGEIEGKEGVQPNVRKIEIPESFSPEKVVARERLDGKEVILDRGESYLIHLLKEEKLDACLFTFFNVKSQAVRPILVDNTIEADYFRRTGIYPINHTVVLKATLIEKLPELPVLLVEAFRQAKAMASDYMNTEIKKEVEIEIRKLGGKDPFEYRLGDDERRTIETFIKYQIEQGLLMKKVEVNDLFAKTTISQ